MPKFDNIRLDTDFREVQNLLKKTRDEARTNMQKLTKQMVRRVPRLVGKRVSERYNIPANEIYPPAYKVKTDKGTGAKRKINKLSKMNIKGEDLESLVFTWEGRRPTLQRFKPKPNKVLNNKEPYDITFSVLRGERQTLEAPEGFRNFVAELNSGVHIVYATNNRSSAMNRKIIDPVRAVSVPVMIDQKDVRENIQRDINETMLKELKALYK